MLVLLRKPAGPKILNIMSINPPTIYVKTPPLVVVGRVSQALVRRSLCKDQMYSYTHSLQNLQYGFRTAFKTLHDLQHFKSLSRA
jgi:hypothetical protein